MSLTRNRDSVSVAQRGGGAAAMTPIYSPTLSIDRSIYLFSHSSIYISIYIYLSISISIYADMYVCIYIYHIIYLTRNFDSVGAVRAMAPIYSSTLSTYLLIYLSSIHPSIYLSIHVYMCV